jgi:hypothetical protein
MFAPEKGVPHMTAELDQVTLIDTLKSIVIEKIMETNDMALLDLIFQLLLFGSRV